MEIVRVRSEKTLETPANKTMMYYYFTDTIKTTKGSLTKALSNHTQYRLKKKIQGHIKFTLKSQNDLGKMKSMAQDRKK